MATGRVSDIERGTDETFDFLCSVCKGKNKNTEAAKFCLECHDYYCSVCVKCHDEIPALKTHKILDKSQLKTSSGVMFPAVPTERCTKHGHKLVDMYCQQHDAVVCSGCMVVQHSSCNDKFYVPNYIQNNIKATDSKNISLELDSISDTLKELQKAFIQEKEKLKESKEQSLKQIRTFRKEINKLLDELERNTFQELEKRFQTLNDKLEEVLKDVQSLTTEIKCKQDSLCSAGSNMAQMFVSIKTANTVVAYATVKVHSTQSQVSSTEISVVAHQKLDSLMKEIKSLGTINLTEKLQAKLQSSERSLLQSTKMSSSSKSHGSRSIASLLKTTGSKKYNVEVQSDQRVSNIVSACSLEDGTIVLADLANNKLKRLKGFSYTVTDYCDVPVRPWQVCAISNEEVVVSCDNSKRIQFVSVGQKMQKTRQISTEFTCCGLAHADGNLFVSDWNTSDYDSVYVYTVTGERQQQFSKDQFGQQMFSSIRSVAVSSDNTKIFVADYDKGLIIIDRTGQLVGQFNGPELQEAYGVCLYNDSVLVCGFKSMNVLQFNSEGKLLGEVLKTNGRCQAICCSSNNTHITVGFHSANEIEVNDIKKYSKIVNRI